MPLSPEDRQRLVEEILARRTRSNKNYVSDNLSSLSSNAATSSITPTAAPTVKKKEPSIWKEDRVILSLEAKLYLSKQKQTQPLNLAVLYYSNRLKVLEIVPGLYVEIEPTGCYKLTFNPSTR